MAEVVTDDPVINAQSNSQSIIAICSTLMVISSLVVATRLYIRFFVIHSLGIDDFTIFCGLSMAIIASVFTCLEATTGLGKHVWTIDPDIVPLQLTYLYVVLLAYNLTTNIIKLAFLFQFRRIFAEAQIQRICFWSIIFIVLWAFVQVLLIAFACIPISLLQPHMEGKCLDSMVVWYFTSAMNIVTDFFIFLIPIPSVIRLQLPTRQRILLCGVFGLGFFTCIISIIRIFTLHYSYDSNDITWDNTSPACWSIAEIHCAIVCSSLPTLRPLLARFIPSLGSRNASAGYEMYGERKVTGSGSRDTKSRGTRATGDPTLVTTTEIDHGDDDTGSTKALKHDVVPDMSRPSSSSSPPRLESMMRRDGALSHTKVGYSADMGGRSIVKGSDVRVTTETSVLKKDAKKLF